VTDNAAFWQEKAFEQAQTVAGLAVVVERIDESLVTIMDDVKANREGCSAEHAALRSELATMKGRGVFSEMTGWQRALTVGVLALSVLAGLTVISNGLQGETTELSELVVVSNVLGLGKPTPAVVVAETPALTAEEYRAQKAEVLQDLAAMFDVGGGVTTPPAN